MVGCKEVIIRHLFLNIDTGKTASGCEAHTSEFTMEENKYDNVLITKESLRNSIAQTGNADWWIWLAREMREHENGLSQVH